jgi:putative cytoplasmic protein
LERSFYEKEREAANWNVRTLRRQVDAALYLRLASSTDKQGILKLSMRGIAIQEPTDIIKDRYTLELLGITERNDYSESQSAECTEYRVRSAVQTAAEWDAVVWLDASASEQGDKSSWIYCRLWELQETRVVSVGAC